MKNWLLLTVLVGLVGLLPACSGPPPEPAEIVAERAQQRWDHIIEGNPGAAWSLYTPGFREINPVRDFSWEMNRRAVVYERAEVRRVDCPDEARCTALVQIAYRAPTAPSGMGQIALERGIQETWVRIDGEWWFFAD